MSFDTVKQLENRVAEFFGSPYAVAVDCCTHGVELCLRHQKVGAITVPRRTYISIPFLTAKLDLSLEWRDEEWQDYYKVNHGSRSIYDAAVLWKKDSYIPGSFMCLSFQFQKHLSLGRGGMILCDNKEDAIKLKKMTYDGRLPDIPWRDQDIDTVGYHYYMTPETAQIGLDKLDKAIETTPRQWKVTDWPDVSAMKVFNYESEVDPYLQTR
jgi:dTDP-4-amino-4,6-dideoxygalactose transaminase|tara:strand:- start:1457 stop:2089 length:633 start_codon:yes stop_codon:yes gene_type:complete